MVSPARQSSGKREHENVRPIFWAHRRKSYVSRTDGWDEFPNGRWGDSRSPAFGELDGYGVSLKMKPEDVVAKWGEPTSVADVCKLFVNFLKGELDRLPWNDEGIAPETVAMKDLLVMLNQNGYLTINSQPPVNGVSSDDKVFGWGGPNGYIYQKAYLEFFVAPEKFAMLEAKLKKRPTLTYFAVDTKGNLTTNGKLEHTNAVTWGVFPSSEIIQPTVVDAQAFMAWKDEAFELWRQWAAAYPPLSQTATLMNQIADKWLLVNLVENDYIRESRLAELFDEPGARVRVTA